MKQIQEQIWQYLPTENQSKEGDHPVKKYDALRSLELFGSHLPNLRFACPSCGKLDVFLSKKENLQELQANCLDCKKTWLEEVNL